MQQYLFGIFALILFATIVSCKKAVHKVDSNYIGSWNGYGGPGCTYFLSIDENSFGTWVNTGGGSDCGGRKEEGKVRINKTQTELKLGFFTFDIISKPTEINTQNPSFPNATWSMTVRCKNWCRGWDVTYFR